MQWLALIAAGEHSYIMCLRLVSRPIQGLARSLDITVLLCNGRKLVHFIPTIGAGSPCTHSDLSHFLFA